ncbi:phage antirepressor KilAC domain-containing protein [Rhodococcus sp. YH3-3]|uniref:phage antirepressor KilAC domain-containing protein n=1 Tax=Rhodococcus sp. YH3-3 TaxID=1803579 RepID=UPI0007DB1AFC|nr:phage antirepressor KilAC domain-containing protein [Rhodococcus sp. YH3-3]
MSDLNLFNPDESPFDSIRQVHPDGSEFWSARDLMPLLGYEKWERFEDAIDRAVDSMRNSGQDPMRNASRRREAIAKTARTNWHLSRFACYLVAMNGDPRKSEVAAAQAYFAIRTREAETAPAAVTELSRLDILKLAIAAEEEKAALQSQVAVMAPKADYVDRYVTDEDVLSFSTVASTLGLTESRLREILIEHDWIYTETATRWSHKEQRKKPVNRYTEKAHKKSYFQRVESHEAPRFRGEVMHTLKITTEGAQAIARAVERWTKEAAA